MVQVIPFVEQEHTVPKGVRLPVSMVARIARHGRRIQPQYRACKITEAMAIRDLLELGLGVAEGAEGTPAQNRQEGTGNLAPVQRDAPKEKASTDVVEDAGYDTAKFFLGSLCKRGHEFQSTGKTLRTRQSKQCRPCMNERARGRRQGKKDAVGV